MYTVEEKSELHHSDQANSGSTKNTRNQANSVSTNTCNQSTITSNLLHRRQRKLST